VVRIQFRVWIRVENVTERTASKMMTEHWVVGNCTHAVNRQVSWLGLWMESKQKCRRGSDSEFKDLLVAS